MDSAPVIDSSAPQARRPAKAKRYLTTRPRESLTKPTWKIASARLRPSVSAPANAAHNHHDSDLLDRTGIWVSVSCFVHCVATAILFSVPGLVSQWLRFLPMLEQLEHLFLLLAVAVAGASLLPSYRRHKQIRPLIFFACGTVAWTLRLVAPAAWEILLTMTGVIFVTTAHTLNMRAERSFRAHHAHCC